MVSPVVAAQNTLVEGVDGFLAAPVSVPFTVASLYLPGGAVVVAALFAFDAGLNDVPLILIRHAVTVWTRPVVVPLLLANVLADRALLLAVVA